MTKVPGSPTVRRRELGALLRALRAQRGWTVEYVAERLLVSPSKVSRLETGRRGASARDIRDLSDLYQVDGQQRQRLTDLAAEGKQQAWWQSRDLPYSTYVGLEADAMSISDFGIGLVPGLLQTADYAISVVRATAPPIEPDVVRRRVEARMARQRLLVSDDPPIFKTVLDESVLHRVVGGPAVMHGQLQRLLQVAELPNVTVCVLPYATGAMPVSNNKFIVLAFAQPEVRGVVFIEGLTGDLYLDTKDDLKIYSDAFDAMETMALSPADSCAMIASFADSYRERRSPEPPYSGPAMLR